MKAVIDIGTNSVLLLLARRDAEGRVEIAQDLATVTRLGRGVSGSGRLDPAAVERTLEVLAHYRDLARSHGAELLPVATEGLRMAEDRDDFLRRARECLGVGVRMISGDEEAMLSYLSVAREAPEGQILRVLDIGGGSTELVAGHGEIIDSRRSHKIGSVRLTERFIDADPPSGPSLVAIERATRAALAEQPLAPHPELHGLAGTVTTAAALLLGLPEYDREKVDRQSFSEAAVRALRDELALQTIDERSARPCLAPGRADVIVTGLTILLVALEHCGAATLVVRDRGLRYALV